jgi:uncharacterized protein (DUF927 family)
MPISRIVNVDTGIKKLKLAFRIGNNKWEDFIITREEISSANSITNLSRYGISVTSENSKTLVKYLQDIQNFNHDKLELFHSVTRMGWIADYGFSPYCENLEFDGDANFTSVFENIKSSGNRQEWFNMASAIRAGNVPARIILAASFASVLVEKCNALPFFVHLWSSESESGKTVAQMVAASVWGNPSLGGYIQTFKSTIVGHERMAAFFNSLPLIIDELQMAKDGKGEMKFDVYALAEGVGKTRGNKNGGVDKTPTWKNCIITSGESPITKGNCGAGAMNRVIDIECNANNLIINNAPNVVDTILLNYGFAGREFVEKINGKETEIKEMFKKFNQELQETKATAKQSGSAALILTADALLSEYVFCDDRNLSVQEIQGFLLSKEQIDVNARAYQYICDWVSIYKTNFDSRNNSELYGLIEGGVAYIYPSKFESVLEEKGYSSRGFISWLKAKGKLKYDNGRDQTRKMINGDQKRCYGLYLNFEEETKPFDL